MMSQKSKYSVQLSELYDDERFFDEDLRFFDDPAQAAVSEAA